MKIIRKPEWLKRPVLHGEGFFKVQQNIEDNQLHTICSSGKCPNRGECWNKGTATLMILGDICTRSCKFCATKTGKPLPPNPNEPNHAAECVKLLNLKHCVITSVDRDDLTDKGAAHWASVIQKIKEINPDTSIEALFPDFDANPDFIHTALNTPLQVASHNMETVERLTSQIRSRADYRTSLKTLEWFSKYSVLVKTGIMLGLGETETEVIQLMKDCLSVGTQLLTIGQYLQPTSKHIEVREFIRPEQFETYRKVGIELGFKYVESAPFVRSSYMAEEGYRDLKN